MNPELQNPEDQLNKDHNQASGSELISYQPNMSSPIDFTDFLNIEEPISLSPNNNNGIWFI